MNQYFLSEDVYFCVRGGSFIFLNLRDDNYILVDGASASALRSVLANSQESELAPETRDALDVLVDGGLLAKGSPGRTLRPTVATLATEEILDGESAGNIPYSIGHVWNFFLACSKAAWSLRRNPIRATVYAVCERKAANRDKSFELSRARDLTAIFHNLRVFFPRDYLCLYDSLALLEFLARYGLFPAWVFGVRLEPWGAHCWVQEHNLVLDDDPEESCRNYTPVMVI